MLVMILQLAIQLVFGLMKLAIQLGVAMGYLLGRLLGAVIGSLWSAWDRRRRQVPLRSPDIIPEAFSDRDRSPPPPPDSKFVPRPLRPRPRR